MLSGRTRFRTHIGHFMESSGSCSFSPVERDCDGERNGCTSVKSPFKVATVGDSGVGQLGGGTEDTGHVPDVFGAG